MDRVGHIILDKVLTVQDAIMPAGIWKRLLVDGRYEDRKSCRIRQYWICVDANQDEDLDVSLVSFKLLDELEARAFARDRSDNPLEKACAVALATDWIEVMSRTLDILCDMLNNQDEPLPERIENKIEEEEDFGWAMPSLSRILPEDTG